MTAKQTCTRPHNFRYYHVNISPPKGLFKDTQSFQPKQERRKRSSPDFTPKDSKISTSGTCL